MWFVVMIPLLFLLFTWILHWMDRGNEYALTGKEMILAYGVRVLLGCVYGYIFSHYFPGDDTWYFHTGSLEEQQKLISSPLQFFADLDPIPAFERNNSFFQGWYYYLSDLEFWMLTKPMAIFNFISRGNYYTNILLFNFISIWGSLWIYRAFAPLYPERKKLLYFVLFLLPVPLFWMTGIRAEGYLLVFIGLAISSFSRLLQGVKPVTLLSFLIALAGMVILRSVLLFILIPALFIWWLQAVANWKFIKAIGFIGGISLLIFWGSAWISSEQNLPQMIVHRQQAFFTQHGQTRFALDSLRAEPGSYVMILPQALGNTFLRPYFWEAKGPLQWAASCSCLFLLLLLILYVFRNYSHPPTSPLLVSMVVFGFLLYLFIGYTVPFPGAIIRYKSLGEYFLLIPLFMGIAWTKKTNRLFL